MAETSMLDCDQTLKTRIAENLAQHQVRSVAVGSQQRHAAVALTVADEGFGADVPGLPNFATWQHRAALILTRRSRRLKNHPGQWAIPGGRVDDGESPEMAALRELREEVLVQLSPSAVLGRLDDFVTRSGFVITPIVVWGGADLVLERNPDEVQSIHRIPAEEFLRPDAPILEASETGKHPVLRMPVGKSRIAAPTAAILYQFREVCLIGNDTRVAHFDQPQFAWR